MSKYTILSHFWKYIYLPLAFNFLVVLSNFAENSAKLEVWNSINIHKICFCNKKKSPPCTYSAEHLKASKESYIKGTISSVLLVHMTDLFFNLLWNETATAVKYKKHNCCNVTIWRQDTYRRWEKKHFVCRIVRTINHFNYPNNALNYIKLRD